MTLGIREVARAAGVSVATVSKVLSGAGGYQISPLTAERVRRAASELGYVPNAAARGLRRRRSGQLGVVLEEVGATGSELHLTGGQGVRAAAEAVRRTFDGAILAGLSAAARAAGVAALVVYPQSAEHDPKDFLDGRVDGLLVGCDPLRGHRLIDQLDPERLPLVALWTQRAPAGVGYADVDQRGGGRQATEHLLALGHRRIGFYGAGLGGSVEHFRLRHQGHLDALAAAGLAAPPEGHLRTPGEVVEAVRAGRISALFAETDVQAAAVLGALLDAGLTVPGDLSLMGFDDVSGAEFIGRGLSTVYHPATEMASAGVQALLRRLSGEPPEACQVLVPTRLVLRHTTAPP